MRQADVVIENFSPRVMDQFGLGADALLELNPELVVVRMPAFGLTGPWRDRVGFAPTMEQIAGLAWVTGLPEGPPVAPRGACDPLAGAHAAFAALAALEFADRTGRGQLVEVPMIETVLNVTAVQTMEFEVFGRSWRRRQPRAQARDAGHLPVRGRGRLDRGRACAPTTSVTRWPNSWADRTSTRGVACPQDVDVAVERLAERGFRRPR